MTVPTSKNSRNTYNKSQNPDDTFYIPKGLGIDDPEVSDEFEEGTLQIFGLGPSRLDLENTKAAKEYKKYQPREDRVENGIVIAARKLFLDRKPLTAENIIAEWDTTLTQAPIAEYITAYLATPDFKKKLDAVGANPREGLTAAQQALVSTLVNPDSRSLSFKLKKHKIPWVTFQGWLRQPKFMEHLKLSAEQALEASEAFSLIQLVRKVNSGDQKAIDTALAMTGRWDPANRKQVDAQKLVQVILGVIDSEVQDPATRERIGQKLAILGTNAAVADDPIQIQGELDG